MLSGPLFPKSWLALTVLGALSGWFAPS